jgi:hypothetical protein
MLANNRKDQRYNNHGRWAKHRAYVHRILLEKDMPYNFILLLGWG